ncbi:LuxR C-terminal-related transcriptional regulator [Streptomyces sp. NPDC056401]|uniref:LuxR C-terminal-related transcriptional regulator n=1 Tax=Streptomyces sp. NPDC056401 TaxID=3345809 RepID=UPI0035D98F7F
MATRSRASAWQALEATAATSPSLTVVTGPAQVGKSTLVAALAGSRAAAGRTHLTGRCCGDAEGRFPLAPLVEALAGAGSLLPEALPPIAGTVRAVLPELAAHLPPAPALPDGPGAERHQLYRGLHALIAALRPVLVLEDLHDADPATWQFLRYLVTRLPSGVSLVLTARASAATGPALADLMALAADGTTIEEIGLRPLDVPDVRHLARRELGTGDVTEAFAHAVHRHTGGLPGLAGALLAAAGPAPAAQAEPTAIEPLLAGLPVPTATRRAILSEFARLGTAGRELVSAACALSTAAGSDTLARIADVEHPLAARAAQEAVDAGLLTALEDGRLTAAHPAVRPVLRELVPAGRLRLLHHRAARHLAAGPDRAPLAALAHHRRHAADPTWPRYAEAAADAALREGRGEDCVALLREALDPSRGADRTRLTLKISRAALTGRPDPRTVALLRRSLADDELPVPARGEVRLNLGLLLRNQNGAGADGLDEIARAIPDLSHAPDLAARAMSALAVPSINGWPIPRHLLWLARAEHLTADLADTAMTVAVHANRATTLMFTADPGAWAAVDALPARPAGPAERQHLARTYGNLAHATVALGHPKAASRFLDCAEGLLRDTDSPYYTGLALTAELLLAWTGGHWTDLEERAAAAAAQYADIPDLAAEAALLLGLHALASGHVGTARRHLKEAQTRTSLDTGIVTTAAAGALSRIDLASGRPDRAALHALSAIDRVRHLQGWMWAAEVAPSAVEALTATGDHSAAADLIAEFERGLRGRDAPAGHAALAACHALHAEGTGRPAAQLWAHTRRAWAGADRPYEAARARLATGRSRLATDQAGASDVLAAIDEFTALGALWDHAQARRLLKDHGITPPSRGGRKSYGTSLSPREQEVAELAAQGMGNIEIADHLVLSRRTVEHHIANALRKLAVTSRTELAAALATGARTPNGH